MKISSVSRNTLAEIVTTHPYRSGPVLVALFNDFFERQYAYGQGFPSRIAYAKSKIDSLNDSEKLQDFIEEVFHLSHFDGDLALMKEVINRFNAFLSKDGFSVEIEQTIRGIKGRVKSLDSNLAQIRNIPISHEFINEQIDKCHEKLSRLPPDIDGAITNARSLLESVMEFVLNELKTEIPKYDGNINTLYKAVKKHLNLDPHKDLADSLKEILSGLSSIVNGLAGLSNNSSDRHTRKHKPLLYHANLAVNSSFTLSGFLLDALKRKKSQSTS
jgi:hypothetical protein